MPNHVDAERAVPAHSLLHELERLHARLEQTPLAVAVFMLSSQGGREYLLPCLHERMLSCDSLFPLTEDRYVLLLPGAGLFKAQALVEAIVRAVPDSGLTVGIASGSGFKHHPETLLEQAAMALRQAKEKGDALCAFRDAVHPLRERKTLVRSDEKRFLFSGGD